MAAITGLALGLLGSTALASPGGSDLTHQPNEAQGSSMPEGIDDTDGEWTTDQMRIDLMDRQPALDEMLEMAKSHEGTGQFDHATCGRNESTMSGMMSGMAQSDMSTMNEMMSAMGGDYGTMMPTP